MVYSRIKGITVEIGGDTTKLQTALKGVNTEIRNTQAQLKDINKLLKLDPGNTELLAQKHKLLGSAVEETKQKLSMLKTDAEQANTALANGEISQSQYDALQREIIETEQELKRLEEQANQSATALQKISATGTKFQEVGSKISGVGKAILPVSAAVAGIGAAGVKVASDFEAGMSQVKAITGAAGSDFEALRQKAIDLGASTSFSSKEVAEAMSEMAKAGFTSALTTIKTKVSSVFGNILSGIKSTMGNIVSSIKSGFNSAISFITSLPSKALQWGKDIIMGIVNGIRSVLHFSVPDEGPLVDYESWMPDFMAGLAKGIEQSRSRIPTRCRWMMWRRIPAARRKQGRRRGMWCGLGA